MKGKMTPPAPPPMPGLSKRAQALLTKPRQNIVIGKRSQGEIPQAFRSKQ